MADNTNVLGISGQMDISDIQSTIDKLCSSLQQIGVDTDALSSRMTKALNEIAKSDEDISSKTQQAMSVLKQAMDEMSKGMEGVPSMIKVAQQHVDDYQSSIAKLNTELSNTPHNSSAYDEITKQLEAQQSALKLAQEDVHDLTEAYNNANEVMGRASATYEALSAATTVSAATGQAQSVTNVEVGASAAATGAEAAAHISNAAAATQNAEAENANVEATKNLTSSLQEYISVASGRAEIERMQSESAKDLRNDIKMYEESIKEIQATLDGTNFTQKISDATAAIEKQQGKIETYKEALVNLSPDEDATGQGTNYYNSLIDQAQQKIADLQSQIEGWQQQQQTLNADLEEYNTLLDAAKQIQGGETIIPTESEKFSVDVDSTSLGDLRNQLDESKTKLQELQAEADKFNGKSLGDTQKAKLADLNKEIDETKEKISVLQDAIKEKNEDTFVGRLRNQLSELKDKLSEFGSELKEKVTAPFTELGNKISGSSFGQRFSAEFSQVKAGMEDFKDGAVSVITANGKLQENMGNLTKAIGGLGIPLNGALVGVKAVTKALWGMCATPVGAVLAAIVLALKAVYTWMTKSATGQRVMTKLSAYLGSVMSSLTDIVVTLGEYIYHCFTDNNGPLRDFGNNLATTFKTAGKAVMNILEGIGNTLKGILKGDLDTFVAGVKKAWQGINGIGDTVVSAFKTSFSLVTGTAKFLYDSATNDQLHAKLSQQMNGIFSNASKAANLAEQQLNTEIAIKNEKNHQLELDKQIAEKREDIYRLSGQERINAIAQAKALEHQKYDGILKLQRDQLRVQQQQMKLHTVSLEDLGKERELRAGILRTEAQRAASTRMLTRQEEAARRSMARQQSTADKAAKREANKEFKQNEATKAAQGKYDETVYTNDQEREKVVTDLETKIADARIAAMREGFTRTQAERKRLQEKELQGLMEAEENAIEAERKRQKAEFDAQQAIRKAQGKPVQQWDNERDFDENTADVKNIRQSYATLRQLTTQRQMEDDRKANEQQAQSLYNYLKAYGTMQEQRLAIAKEYDQKIADADTEGDRLILVAQKARALSDFDIKAQKQDMNWEDIFGNLGSMTKDQLGRIKEQLKGMLSSNDLDVQGYKDIVGQIDKVNGAILSAEDKQRGFLGVAVSYNTERRKLEMDVADALERQNQAFIDMGNAQANLTMQRFSLQQQLGGMGIDMAQGDIKTANADNILAKVAEKSGGTDTAAYKKVKDALDALAKSEGEYNNAVKKNNKATNDAQQKQSKLNKYLSDFSEKLKDLMPLFEQINSNIQDIPGLLSTLGVSENSSLGKAASTFAEGSNSAMSAMQDYMSGNYVGAAMNGMKAVGSYVQSATNLFAGAGNAEAMEKEIAKLSEANKDLATAIDNLSESIENTDNTNEQSVEAYKKAVDAEKEREANQRKMINNRASEYSNSGHGFLGMSGRHSFNKYANDNRGAWLSAFNTALRQNGYKGNLRSVQDVWNLSPEELKAIQTYAAKAWTAFFNSGGESNPRELVEEYIQMAGQLDDLNDSLNEKLTGYSWDSFKDSYESLIKDLTSDTDDFADHINEVISNALLSSIMNNEFKDRIKQIYDYLADAAKDDNLTEDEIEKIREMNKALSEDMIKRRQQLIDAGLITVSSTNEEQSASAKGVSSITYDQANILANLATARNIALEKGNEVRQMILDKLNDMGVISDYPTAEIPAIPQTNGGNNDDNSTLDNPWIDVPTLRDKLGELLTFNLSDALASLPNIASSPIIDTSKLVEALQEASDGKGDNSTQEAILAVQQLMQVDMGQIRINTAQIQGDVSVMRDIQEQGLTQLQRIEANTRPISVIRDDVADIKRIVKDSL